MVPLALLLQLLLHLLPDDGVWRSAGGSIALAFAPSSPTAARPHATDFASLAATSSPFAQRAIDEDRRGIAAQRPPRRTPTSGRPRLSTLVDVSLGASSKNNGASNYKPPDDGRSVGFVLLGLSLLVSAWLFTIPPSFRRAYLCPSDYFVGNSNRIDAQSQPTPAEADVDCVPWDVWWSNVFQYYKDGGGIQWDFSIDPQTLRDNQEFLDAVVSSYSSKQQSTK